MASENETIAKVLDDFAYLITIGDIGPNIATDIKSRIEAAHKREIAAKDAEIEELQRTLDLHDLYADEECDDADVARIVAENVAAEKDTEIAELRECLAGALEIVDCTVAELGIAERAKAYEDYKRWHKALDWERSK